MPQLRNSFRRRRSSVHPSLLPPGIVFHSRARRPIAERFQPPDFGGEGKDANAPCASNQAHNSGAFTIQLAIDQVKAAGGGMIASEVGTTIWARLHPDQHQWRAFDQASGKRRSDDFDLWERPAIVVDGSTDDDH
jgi:hypothetical protein